MTPAALLGRMRVALSLLAVALFAGTIVELLTIGHDEDPLQLIPYLFCGLAILSLIAVWGWRSPAVLWIFRGVMLATAGSSVLGMYEHVSGNLAFVREIDPSASGWTALREALSGEAPLMAPATLAFGAALGLVATAGWNARPAAYPAPQHDPRLRVEMRATELTSRL
jgi:hypothetical protein